MILSFEFLRVNKVVVFGLKSFIFVIFKLEMIFIVFEEVGRLFLICL